MIKPYIYYLLAIFFSTALFGCREDSFSLSDEDIRPGEVRLNVVIDNFAGNTRGIMEESKEFFDVGELLHIQAIYHCDHNGEKYKTRQYGLLEYKGHGKWEPHNSSRSLNWPDEAVTGDFKAFFLAGSTGELNGNISPAKLLSDFKFAEVPLKGEVTGIDYGTTVSLRMTHLFTYITLNEMDNGVASDLWFSIPSIPGERELNNAFYLDFNPDPESFDITPTFTQIPSSDYKDSQGNGLVFVKAKLNETPGENDIGTMVSYFLEPGVYHTFDLIYPRGRNSYATYLSYNRDLEFVTGKDGLKANFRYVFSILKSLGIIVQQNPDDGWDEKEPTIIVDVEEFLRAVNRGTDYFVEDLNSGEQIQILERTSNGTRLLQNIDFNYEYYASMGSDNFKAVLNSVFDGNYHYIYHTACPLFYANYGTITNLGIRDSETRQPLVSCEHWEEGGFDNDLSYNGLIASYNYATVINVRVDNAKMEVKVLGRGTQESHNISLLFGVNRGNIYDIGLAGKLQLSVSNYPDREIIPRVNIGTATAQNLGSISGLSYIEDKNHDYDYPEIKILNNCIGSNGVYKVGGVCGNNMGTLEEIFLPVVSVDASASQGLESYLGGIAGEIPTSNSGSPRISGCIVRGDVKAGEVKSVVNLLSLSYTGGLAGSANVQCILINNSVSIDVVGPSSQEDGVEYGQGGAFGILKSLEGYSEGDIDDLACYPNKLSGPGYTGNFAGIVPKGYGWEEHFQNKNISLKQSVDRNIGRIED
ncbi:MAG: hypothetical protein J1D77_03140 [Muribaculaceae bacterium]|nr:hypothetical protein [Muribaculaceae bacterium]